MNSASVDTMIARCHETTCGAAPRRSPIGAHLGVSPFPWVHLGPILGSRHFFPIGIKFRKKTTESSLKVTDLKLACHHVCSERNKHICPQSRTLGRAPPGKAAPHLGASAQKSGNNQRAISRALSFSSFHRSFSPILASCLTGRIVPTYDRTIRTVGWFLRIILGWEET
jgi:hypothetical protein